MKSIGICTGASTISMVGLERNGSRSKITFSSFKHHEGSPRQVLHELLGQVENVADYKICVTGRKFRKLLTLTSISEPQALELATGFILPPDHPYRVVISAGGETTMVYHLDEDGRVNEIHTGNKCASGTGEFFLQQLRRMSITLDQVSSMTQPANPYAVSGRCSVFCKSDCTHALNKGVTKHRVVAGLSRMMSNKILELLKKLPKNSIMLVGGCTGNRNMVHYLQEVIPDLYIPTEAFVFEALGAALWALDNATNPLVSLDEMFVEHRTCFSVHEPLTKWLSLVDYRHQERGVAEVGDRLILGLDVGSTTTKGVLLRRKDKVVVAAEYLRTSGDPINASRKVYKSLKNQIAVPVVIEALGVTGSGRQIAGLYALTDGVINEIVAHAAAAVHCDADVDTIFEIGGQDAKYTYITNGVPSDYAMNEACSAGTGSFLEESAFETLGLEVTEIGDIAFKGRNPPNFNDQCAAFIGSDIKRAVQENLPLEDIVAGLVYSIAMNYNNRVKGNRPVGKKIFMQGGVCYNRAVPAAIAGITGKKVVVPEEAGFMGAIGVAIEVERRMEQGLLKSKDYDLQELIGRYVEHGEPFKCSGDKFCDRGCEISRIKIDGKTYPFGGNCNRYDNLIHNRKVNSDNHNLVIFRELRVFRDLAPDSSADSRPTIGMNRSFLINTYFPFFNNFFAELGFRLILPSEQDPRGADQQGAAFCYPCDIAHNYAASLIKKNANFIFLPHLRGLNTGEMNRSSCTCVLVQGEPYYLRNAFPSLEINDNILTQVLDFSTGYASNRKAFWHLARSLGADQGKIDAALRAAEAAQEEFNEDIRKIGGDALEAIEADPEKFVVVLFGRPYNSFATIANKGIPAKFASRGITIIPFDMLPYWQEELATDDNMYWAMGQIILKGARFVKRHPRLYGTYITNFSCGPDSFLVSYFRDIMGRKPSLTLELDSHTADAGLETRIEAFLDVVRYYRQIQKTTPPARPVKNNFRLAVIAESNGVTGVRTSDSRWLPLTAPEVRLILPAMSRYASPLLAASFGRVGIRAEVLQPADEDVLKLGRGHTTCKECLPLKTTLGSLLTYLQHRSPGEVLLYYMASSDGPCRLGQYHVYTKRLVEKLKIPDVAMFTPTSMNGYCDLGYNYQRAAWRAIVIGDLFDEMWATILAGARDREGSTEILHQEFIAIKECMDKRWPTIGRQLSKSAARLSRIELKKPYLQIPKISLIGEMYVRHDPISLQNIIEQLAERGFIVRTAGICEWVKYIDWLIQHGIEGKISVGFGIRKQVKKYFDNVIRRRLAPSGLFFHQGKAPVEPIINAGKKFLSPYFTLESILTVGSALHDILQPSCGIIAIGPFGCMPSRVAEAILNEKFTTAEKRAILNKRQNMLWWHILSRERKLPFLAIETDGNPLPQIIEARIEAFCLQANRLHERIMGCQSSLV